MCSTRESLAIEVGQGLKGDDVVRVLRRLGSQRAVPKRCSATTDRSSPPRRWTCGPTCGCAGRLPGSGPPDNAHVESFNGTLRSECLDAHWFASLADAKQIIEAWRREYNESRPHGLTGRGRHTKSLVNSRLAAKSQAPKLPETHSRDDAEKGDRSHFSRFHLVSSTDMGRQVLEHRGFGRMREPFFVVTIGQWYKVGGVELQEAPSFDCITSSYRAILTPGQYLERGDKAVAIPNVAIREFIGDAVVGDIGEIRVQHLNHSLLFHSHW